MSDKLLKEDGAALLLEDGRNLVQEWELLGRHIVIETASIPSPSATMDGIVLIEDAGPNTAYLVVYKGGERFKVGLIGA